MADGADATAEGVEKLAMADTAKKPNVRLLRTSQLARMQGTRCVLGTLRTVVGAARVRAGYAGNP